MFKKIIQFSLIYFYLNSIALSEDLYQSLISTYINNKELNSQRQKAKAVDDKLIKTDAKKAPNNLFESFISFSSLIKFFLFN